MIFKTTASLLTNTKESNIAEIPQEAVNIQEKLLSLHLFLKYLSLDKNHSNLLFIQFSNKNDKYNHNQFDIESIKNEPLCIHLANISYVKKSRS